MSVTENYKQFENQDHAHVYNAFRPNPSNRLVEIILQYLQEKFKGNLEIAVDSGCGSGQSTFVLAGFFSKVYGFDISEAQIKEALLNRNAKNIEYRMQSAEDLPFDDSSVQLVTASSSLHWFRKDVYLSEVRRILVPGGVFAAYNYLSIVPYTDDEEKNKRLNQLMKQVFEVDLRAYWSHIVLELIQNGYKNIVFPFENVRRLDGVKLTFSGKLSDTIGHISSFSGFQNMKEAIGAAEAAKYLDDLRRRFCDILEFDEADSEFKNLDLYRKYDIVLCRKEEV